VKGQTLSSWPFCLTKLDCHNWTTPEKKVSVCAAF